MAGGLRTRADASKVRKIRTNCWLSGQMTGVRNLPFPLSVNDLLQARLLLCRGPGQARLNCLWALSCKHPVCNSLWQPEFSCCKCLPAQPQAGCGLRTEKAHVPGPSCLPPPTLGPDLFSAPSMPLHRPCACRASCGESFVSAHAREEGPRVGNLGRSANPPLPLNAKEAWCSERLRGGCWRWEAFAGCFSYPVLDHFSASMALLAGKEPGVVPGFLATCHGGKLVVTQIFLSEISRLRRWSRLF